MTTCTRCFSPRVAHARSVYGETSFAHFQSTTRSLNIEKDEYWQHSNLNFLNTLHKHTLANLLPLKEKTTTKSSAATSSLTQTGARFAKSLADLYTLIFINGHLIRSLSQLPPSNQLSLEDSTNNKSLHHTYPYAIAALASAQDKTSPHVHTHFLHNLNLAATAYAEGSSSQQLETFIRIPKNASLSKPLVCLFLDQPHAQDKLLTPRLHFHVEPNASLTLIESQQSTHAFLENTFLHLTLAPGAKVIHLQDCQEGPTVNHAHMTHGTLAANSTYHSFLMQSGSLSSIHEKRFTFLGEGAHATFTGLGLGKNRQHFNHILHLHHSSPQTTSQQNYKFVLNNHSRAAFTGNVAVARNAQGVNSAQICKSLLIGAKTVMYTRPQLEILADDVKCAHGATVGQLNPEEIFYLTSRGVPHSQALNMLTFAFIRDFFTPLAEILPHQASFLPAKNIVAIPSPV